MTRRLDDPVTAALRRRALGWSLECPQIEPGADIGRDLVLREGPGGRDLGVVEGIDNLTQALGIALTTALGDDVFNTEFGFDGLRALVEETDPRLARERVKVSAVQVLRSDPRVRRIIDLQLVDPHDPSAPAPRTSAVDAWRTVTVTCAFEAVSGEPVTLAINGVIPHG
jgi:phage baseplate assembly protein W